MSSPPAQEVPDLDTLARWLDDGDAALDALQEAILAEPDPSAAARWQALAERLDRPVAPEGLSPAVLDALHEVMARPARPQRPPRSLRSRRAWWAGGAAALALAAAAMVAVWPTSQETVLLTAAEVAAAGPVLTRGQASSVVAAGPVLAVELERTGDGLRLRIDARPGPEGVPVDPGSLRLFYGTLDLTPRLGALVLPLERDGLVVASGRHRFVVSVADLSGRRSQEEVELVVP